MKNAILSLLTILMVTSCETAMPQSASTGHWGPPSDEGTSIRVRMQGNCPASAIDFYNASLEAPCQAGDVIKSASACRKPGHKVTWNENGNGEFKIVFQGTNPMVTSSSNATGIACEGNPGGGKYECHGTLKGNLEAKTEYRYQIQSGTCPPLDPYIIIY